MGRGDGCCGPSFSPKVGDKNAQVLEGETGLWLPCEIRDVRSLGMCAGKEWQVQYVPSGGGGMRELCVPKEKLREIESAIKLGPDGQPDLDRGRSCTDCPCILFFLLFCAGWAVLASVAFDKGDPKRLLMPEDFRDEICGDKEPRKAYEDWFVPKPEFKLTYGICVRNCPEPGDVVCNNDWEFQDAFENSGLTWDSPPQASWGRNNKAFEMNATETAEVNAAFPNSFPIDYSTGVTGTIARVKSQWPSVPLQVLDPAGKTLDCAWRLSAFGPGANPFTKAANALLVKDARPCTDRETALFARAAEIPTRIVSFNCFTVIYRSDALVNRCVPLSDDSEQSQEQAQKLAALAKSTSAGRYISDGFAEVRAAWRVLLISAFTAIIISFIWLILVRIMLRPIVYLVLLLILVVLVAAGFACHIYANNLEDVTLPGDTSHDEQVTTWRVFSYLFWAAAVIYFVLMCWLINRIRIAICVLEQASMALFSSPSVLVVPPVMFILICCWLAWFLVLAVHIQTIQDASLDTVKGVVQPYSDAVVDTANQLGQLTSPPSTPAPGNLTGNATASPFTSIPATLVPYNLVENATQPNGTLLVDSDTLIRYMHFYNLFGFLWAVQIAVAMAFFIVSGVVIIWFWSASTAELAAGEKSKSTPVGAPKNSTYRMLRYHLGTLFFGALLIAIIQFVRVLLLYIEKQIPEEMKDNASFKILKCLIHCFLAYLERIVKIINKNAFIITGIQGSNFCTSAAKALMFLMANIARVSVLTAMGEVVMFLLKLFICAANVYVAMILLKYPALTDDEEIDSVCFLPLHCSPPHHLKHRDSSRCSSYCCCPSLCL